MPDHIPATFRDRGLIISSLIDQNTALKRENEQLRAQAGHCVPCPFKGCPDCDYKGGS